MKLTTAIESAFRKYLPSPFAIAVLLTLLTILLTWVFTGRATDGDYLITILSYWEQGIWNSGLLVFGYQMMLILVLGHVLVLSRPIGRLILRITTLVTNPANAALLVALPTMLVSFFNWGLGLIFGAVLARKVGEYAQENNIPVNYPLIGASGYVGLMVWHGGISGSSLIKVSEAGHVRELMEGHAGPVTLEGLPDIISTSETVFSTGNLAIFGVLLVLIPLLVYRLGRTARPTDMHLNPYKFKAVPDVSPVGAERIDHSSVISVGFGLLVLAAFALQYTPMLKTLNITPNMLNFFMLGLALVLHGSFRSFLDAVGEAIGDTAGILIQFPLYFGIMGIMGSSGMIGAISDFFVAIATPTTLPVFTFLSAGLVNIFVPSGGGQWAIQGPLVIESALRLQVPLPKAVLALAYGDQVTNMLQPFWALPLLGITKLEAREILPYTLLFMGVGTAVFLAGLLIF